MYGSEHATAISKDARELEKSAFHKTFLDLPSLALLEGTSKALVSLLSPDLVSEFRP